VGSMTRFTTERLRLQKMDFNKGLRREKKHFLKGPGAGSEGKKNSLCDNEAGSPNNKEGGEGEPKPAFLAEQQLGGEDSNSQGT